MKSNYNFLESAHLTGGKKTLQETLSFDDEGVVIKVSAKKWAYFTFPGSVMIPEYEPQYTVAEFLAL